MTRLLRFALGVLLLASIGLVAADDQEKGKTMTATGTVTTVAADSLTIMKGTESMTFEVDASTRIIGKGLSHKTAEQKAEGKKMTLMDSVAKDDKITVKYRDTGGKLHATEVRVQEKKPGTE